MTVHNLITTYKDKTKMIFSPVVYFKMLIFTNVYTVCEIMYRHITLNPMKITRCVALFQSKFDATNG